MNYWLHPAAQQDLRGHSGNVTPVKRLTPALANIEANERKYLDEYRRLNP